MACTTKKFNLKENDGEIDLSMLELNDVPVKEIARVRRVYALDFSNNNLTFLPDNFATLSHITKLDLSKNQLKSLPNNFGDLIKLKHLDLYRNNLLHLPLSFGKLTELRWLDLKDNPLVPAVADVAGPCLDMKQCQQCAKKIVKFYTDLQLQIDREISERDAEKRKKNDLKMGKVKQVQQEKTKVKNEKRAHKSERIVKEPETIPKKPYYNTKTTVRTNSNVETKYFFFTIWSLLFFILLLSAARVEFIKFIEDPIIGGWSYLINNLPDYLKEIALTLEGAFLYCHVYTGHFMAMLINGCYELKSSDLVNSTVSKLSETVDAMWHKMQVMIK